MKILLVKCHADTLFRFLDPIKTEPLELEYIKTALDDGESRIEIHDSNFSRIRLETRLKDLKPDIVLLNGYVTATDTINSYSKLVKQLLPNSTTIVGGVHAQINCEDFYSDFVDYVVHTQSLARLKELVSSISKQNFHGKTGGISFRRTDGSWSKNHNLTLSSFEDVRPCRDFLKDNLESTKYLNYRGLSLLKTSLSCPFSCNFCYCRLLNGHKHVVRPLEDIVDEIESLPSKYIWIVDDTFLIDRKRVLKFCQMIGEKKIKKKFIAYSRADFISENEDVVEILAQTGFIDFIVGMESIDDSRLDSYDKDLSKGQNEKTIGILKKYSINLTALFIVDLNYSISDFKILRRFIKKHEMKVYTLSIFTPMKGTAIYKDYKSELEDTKCKKFDFLHLVLNPVNMSRIGFYFEFYKTYALQLFYNKNHIKFILKRLMGD